MFPVSWTLMNLPMGVLFLFSFLFSLLLGINPNLGTWVLLVTPAFSFALGDTGHPLLASPQPRELLFFVFFWAGAPFSF